MKTGNEFKMRILRFYVSMRKEDLTTWAIVLILFVLAGFGLGALVSVGKHYASQVYHTYIKGDMYDAYNDAYDLSDELRFYENGSHSYIRDRITRKKVLSGISWVSGTDGSDTLLCFAKGDRRGFLHRHSGRIVIPADRYARAWLFSEGLAAVVDEAGIIKFIDTTGKEVIDTKTGYTPMPDGRGIQFAGGYCALAGSGGKWGLIDRRGHWAVKPRFDDIISAGRNFWIVEEKGMRGLLDSRLRMLLEPTYLDVRVAGYGVTALCKDYTRMQLNDEGQVVRRFAYVSLSDLSYKVKAGDEYGDGEEWSLSPFKAYQTTHDDDPCVRVGLLGTDGLPVTMPLYTSIEAVNAGVFRCTVGGEEDGAELSVLIDTQGNVIEPEIP